MAKYINPNVIDLALNNIKTNGNKQVLCTQQPTTFTEANATYALGSVAMSSADYTLANGDTSGRKITVAAKTNAGGAPASVTTSGTVTHVAIVDTTNSALLLVTTTTSTAVAAGGTCDISSWKDEIQAPV
jgi:hypothetical protein